MPTQHLLVKDWEKDLVYLVQTPRAGSIPSLSPFCLKLETWLRMADVRYHVGTQILMNFLKIITLITLIFPNFVQNIFAVNFSNCIQMKMPILIFCL